MGHQADQRDTLTAERVLQGVALGGKAWLFCGPARGGERAAAIYTLIITAEVRKPLGKWSPLGAQDPHRRQRNEFIYDHIADEGTHMPALLKAVDGEGGL
jgi:hypothetical protein